MQLKKIKLSGFKSFVDPTNISLPSQLIAIVGPNGCGKSNIIDAVCWVMGESSAKYLRGESLTDVIFNGSTSRKPVGQASVELVFDNQDGSLGGEYASYAEISIRRVLSREGDSSYFLNGTRCRRRDIIDIFLGTGLGPRSYSIIGQNMISRIIEAKPDDMRMYLEEAAGISKYKERRRETENRIQHTKENLARLNDIRSELEKQLHNLQRQANAAEKFQTLKQEERILRSQWLAVQWRQFDGQMVQYTVQIQQQETGLEARQADLTEITRTFESQREEHTTKTDVFNEVQRRYYAVGNDITRVEQDIRHQEERKRQWQFDLEQVLHDCNEAQTRFDELTDQLQELTEERAELEPASQAASVAAVKAAEQHAEIEEAMQAWQNASDQFNHHTAEVMQTAQVQQTRIQHLEQKITALQQQQVRVEQEKNAIDFSQLEKEIAELQEQVTALTQQSAHKESEWHHVRDDIHQLESVEQETVKELDRVRHELQQLSGRQASLETLQQTALGQRNNPVVSWLTQHRLDKHPRLAQQLNVDTGWELAVEKVLGSYLQAICVENVDDIADALQQFSDGNLHIFTAGNATQKSSSTSHDTLASKVTSQWPVQSLLAHVYIAESLTDALRLSKTLAAHESVITRDGVWLNASWLRISREKNPEAGVFQREQELKQLAQQIQTLTIEEQTLTDKLTRLRDEMKTLELRHEALQHTAQEHHSQTAETQAQLKIKQERLATVQQQLARLQTHYDETIAELQRTQEEIYQARDIWQRAMSDVETHTKQREALQQERETLRDSLQAARDTMNQSREAAHQLEIRLQTTQSQQSSLQQNKGHLENQLTTLAERKVTLENELNSVASTEEFEKTLNALLQQRLQVEEELTQSRAAVQLIDQQLKTLETQRQEVERDIARFRDFLETLRMDWQGLKVKSETLMEQAREYGFNMQDILPTLPQEADANEYHARLEQLTQRIVRLGAINLMAIEEYAACEERKLYLDKQNDDLQQGLATLEDAIEKIDKETRAKFRETFDKVNQRFQELFPQIFGGGRAYLDLTGENLLDTGISVMACPPGKRNSTIHLLSGGEKAMTAIALIFSIFHLNPAPFCLLDEVDAPLDDANIGRFCRLVESMSERTQFLFISHNKLAIEMAQHLLGVTMHEPGVSRLVSVDVQEAISLAGA